MLRRRFLQRALGGSIVIGCGWLGILRIGTNQMPARSPFDRVVFVCTNDHGDYSPGIYLHGPDGGGLACLKCAAEAAQSMRLNEVSDSAAGLCGFLFTKFGETGPGAGGLSLWDSPKPDASGAVDWQQYCAWNVDLVLINVDRRSAECYVSQSNDQSRAKSLVSRLDDLKFGGMPLAPRE